MTSNPAVPCSGSVTERYTPMKSFHKGAAHLLLPQVPPYPFALARRCPTSYPGQRLRANRLYEPTILHYSVGNPV
eukprot:33990-Eustigmatos_ZCMA.PRE.1